MRIAFAFLIMSALVFVSQQQKYTLPHLRNVLPPWSLFPQQPSIHDIYDYLYARSLLETFNPAQLAGRPLIDSQVSNTEQSADVQSRSKTSNSNAQENSSGDDGQSNARFFLNYVTTAGSSSYFNPLLKTIYYISSTTATTTLVSTCVPAVSFTKTLYTVPCRKRREIMEFLIDHGSILEDENDSQSVVPSTVAAVQPSVNPRALDLSSLGKDAILVPVEISGSKTEDYLIEHGYLSETEKLREKRFFIASSTITSYAFVTTSTTKTLSSLGTSLSCLPSQFLLC